MMRSTMRLRRHWVMVLLPAIALTPLLIPAHQRPLRLYAAVFAVMLGVKVFSCVSDASIAGLPLVQQIIYLFNPFSIVRRLVSAEKKPTATRDWQSIILNSALGLITFIIAIRIFSIHWFNHPAMIERCAKTFAIFFVILFVPNAMAAFTRRVGIDSTDFCKPFILARTPAEFWRIYNRPAEQFFRVHVFQPAGGRRHFIRATIATFIVSGLIHEYVFGIPAGHIIGSQMLFFAIQGIAVIITAKLRPRGLIPIIAIPATFTFNVLTGVIFMSGMNSVFPIWTTR